MQRHRRLAQGASPCQGGLGAQLNRRTQLRGVSKEWEPRSNGKVRNKGDQRGTRPSAPGRPLLQPSLSCICRCEKDQSGSPAGTAMRDVRPVPGRCPRQETPGRRRGSLLGRRWRARLR